MVNIFLVVQLKYFFKPNIFSNINFQTDLTDIYWVAVGIFGGIALLILLVLLIAWRQKLKLQYKK